MSNISPLQLNKVVVFLKSPVFSHVQLSGALSKVTNPHYLKGIQSIVAIRLLVESHPLLNSDFVVLMSVY